MNPTGNRADPSAIVRLTTSYWESQVLLTANRLRTFDALADGPRTPEEVASSLNLDARATALFLRACAGLGLLDAIEGRFANSAAAALFLVSRSPMFMGNALRYADQLYETWGRLEQSLKSGQPALAAESYLGDDPSRTRTFVQAMHERALGPARALVRTLDLTGRRRLLDVGGGPATYSVLLTERHPGLHSDVLELPGVAAIARELVAAAGASERVTLVDGDYHVADFGSSRDVVLMSGMLHRETADTCRKLIRRAADCLVPGGLLVVSDVFTERDGTQPLFATLFGLNMMLTAPNGCVHSDADVSQWMTGAGFRATGVQSLPPPMPHRVVTGVKA